MQQTARQLLVLVVIAVEYVGFFSYFAATKPLVVHKGFTSASPNPSQNLLGQGGGMNVIYAVILLAAVYFGKYSLYRSGLAKHERISWYLLMVTAALPYLWLLAAHDWYIPMARDTFCWVGTPVAVLLVPTLSSLAEMASNRASLCSLRLRYAVEIVVLCPIWVVVWNVLEFVFLL
jgi:hypothetical protein